MRRQWARAAGNLVLELVLVYGLGRRVGASAAATVVAQCAGAAVYLSRVAAAPGAAGVGLRPDATAVRALAVVGGDLLVRTAALRAAFLLTTAVATRLGLVPLAAHAVALDLGPGLALRPGRAGDRRAGHHRPALGAGDAALGRAMSRRMVGWGVARAWSFGRPVWAARPLYVAVVPRPGGCQALIGSCCWWWPRDDTAAGVVFVLDGVLIGAGDGRYLALAGLLALPAYAPLFSPSATSTPDCLALGRVRRLHHRSHADPRPPRPRRPLDPHRRTLTPHSTDVSETQHASGC